MKKTHTAKVSVTIRKSESTNEADIHIAVSDALDRHLPKLLDRVNKKYAETLRQARNSNEVDDNTTCTVFLRLESCKFREFKVYTNIDTVSVIESDIQTLDADNNNVWIKSSAVGRVLNHNAIA